MERTIHFISNPGAIVPTGGINYDETVGLNLKIFGADIGGNWNEPDIDYTTLGSVDNDLISLNDGTTTGIACDVAIAATASDISGNTTGNTTNFPAPTYDRGARAENTTSFGLTFSGFSASTNIRATVAVYVTESAYATENGTLQLTNGAGTTSSSVNGTNPTEYQFEVKADSNGDFEVILTADSGSNNGLGICGVKIDYIT